MTDKVSQTQYDLKTHFEEQLDFIERSARAYDNGIYAEAKRIAVAIRVLLHNTKSSIALITQLGLDETTQFTDTARSIPTGGIRHSAYIGLIAIQPANSTYVPNLVVPLLNKYPPRKVGYKIFWEKQMILIDSNGTKFSRKDIVLNLANKEGGAHVSPKLEKTLAELSRNNSLGFIVDHASQKYIKRAELSIARQIGHELLQTFKKEPYLGHHVNGIFVGEMWVETKKE